MIWPLDWPKPVDECTLKTYSIVSLCNACRFQGSTGAEHAGSNGWQSYTCIYIHIHAYIHAYTYWCIVSYDVRIGVCILYVYCMYIVRICTYTRILTYFLYAKLLGASILSYTYNIRVYVQYTYNILNHIRADTSKYMQYTCVCFGNPFQITIFHLACIWTYMQYIHV